MAQPGSADVPFCTPGRSFDPGQRSESRTSSGAAHLAELGSRSITSLAPSRNALRRSLAEFEIFTALNAPDTALARSVQRDRPAMLTCLRPHLKERKLGPVERSSRSGWRGRPARARSGSTREGSVGFDGRVTFSGIASLDLGDGAPPLPSVAFTVIAGADDVVLVIDSTPLPAAGLTAGAVIIE